MRARLHASDPRLAAMYAVAVALVCLVPCAFGQEQSTPTLTLSSNVVLVPTEVQTKKGEMIYDLKPEQFVLEDNGVAQKIHIDEDTDALGLSLVVVVQCSREAFRQFDNMKGLAAMVDDLTGAAPREVALVSYGSEPTLIADHGESAFTNDPRKLSERFAELQPCEDDKAATLDAVAFANHLFDAETATNVSSAAARNRRAILLIGETRDHGSSKKPEVVIAALGRSNTVVDAVSFSPGKSSIYESVVHGKYGPGVLGLLVMSVQALRKNVPQTLAELSGGEYTDFLTQHGFDRDVHQLTNHIHNFYLISFVPSGANGAAPTPGLHSIKVKVPDYPEARLRFRVAYYAGDAPPPDVPDDSAKDKKSKKDADDH